MYLCKESGEYVYETIKELKNANITLVYENVEYYFVRAKGNSFYDNCIWKTDKKTGVVSYMMFTEFILDYMDKTTEIDPQKFKRMIQEKY